MTAGYDPSNPAGSGAHSAPADRQWMRGDGDAGDRPRHAADGQSGESSERLGPLPPRMGPPSGAYPQVPSPSPAPMSPPPPPHQASQPSHQPTHHTGPIPPPGSPVVPGSGAPGAHGVPGVPSQRPTSGGFPPTSGFPVTGAFPAGAAGGSPYQPGGQLPGHPAPPPRRGNGVAITALILVFVLLIVAGTQTWFLMRLDDQLSKANATAASDRSEAQDRIRGLEERAKELERKTGNTLDPQAVAADVTPSVFRVVAGRAGGTAFAFGKEPSGGGTNLITNWHVVEDFYNGGGREVSIERRNEKFTATIVEFSRSNDLAVLKTDEKFKRLVQAKDEAKPGQAVVVIGAPLGLEDSVTAGVVSTERNTPEGRYLQFDAAINPGNSGGPVVNAQREVVGVATAKLDETEGISLARPVDLICSSFDVC